MRNTERKMKRASYCSRGAMPPHFRRQFREYGSGGSRDDLIGAGNLRNQPVCAVDAAPRMRTAERNSSNLQNLHDGLSIRLY